MYGTVFRIRPKPGGREAMDRLSDEEMRERGTIKGFRGAYTLDEANGDRWVLVVFDDEASYRANAASPDQDKWYRRLREHLESDPEWHDGTITEQLA